MCNVHRPDFVFSWQQERTMAHLATYSLTFHPSYERYCFVSKVKKYQSSITEDQKRKVICFCESRLIPTLVMETLLKSFHLEGWPRYFQFDPLTLFDSVLLLCCLFTKGCPLWRVCPCFLSSQRNIFLCKVVFRDLPSCWAGSSLSLSLAGLCKWGEDASRDNVWSVECQVKLFEKEQQHKKYFGEVSKNDNRG